MFISQLVVTLSDSDLTEAAKALTQRLPIKIQVADDHLVVTGIPLTGLKVTPRLAGKNQIACRLGATSPLVPDAVAAQAVTSFVGNRLPSWARLSGHELWVDVTALLAETPVRGRLTKLTCRSGWLEVTVQGVQIRLPPR